MVDSTSSGPQIGLTTSSPSLTLTVANLAPFSPNIDLSQSFIANKTFLFDNVMSYIS